MSITNNGAIREYAMGFPFHFIWYRSSDEFTKFQLLVTGLKDLQINLIYYLLSVLAIYLFSLVILRVLTHIKSKKATV